MSPSPTPSPRPAPVVECPACGEATRFAPDNAWRPFCSQRCKLQDLGAWANEGYRVAATEPPDDTLDPSGR